MGGLEIGVVRHWVQLRRFGTSLSTPGQTISRAVCGQLPELSAEITQTNLNAHQATALICRWIHPARSTRCITLGKCNEKKTAQAVKAYS